MRYGPSVPVEARSASRQSVIGITEVEVPVMTIQHQTWLAEAFAASAMLAVLYFILVEFSKARLP